MRPSRGGRGARLVAGCLRTAPGRNCQRARLSRAKSLADVPVRDHAALELAAGGASRGTVSILSARRARSDRVAADRSRKNLAVVLGTPRRILRGALSLSRGWAERMDAGGVAEMIERRAWRPA